MLLLGSLDAQKVGTDDISVVASNHSRLTAFSNVSSSQGPLPVTRSGHVDHLADPTTFGVHLYKDQKPLRGPPSSPAGYTLFADCEGFFTGAAQTNAERLTSGQGITPAEEDALEANLLYKEPVTANISTQDGQGRAESYYARFLYSISDVVVFVTNEDQNITSLLTSALEWAATAVLHSVNYPSRKTLIIVRNGAVGQRQQIIDTESLERLYLDRQTVNLWRRSGILQTFVNDYNRRQDKYSKHIYDNRDLYDVLFDRTLCFCIPRVDDIEEYRDEKAFAQYLGLRTLIDEASRRAVSMRSQVWMTYDVASFSQMLFAAFEHFRTSDKPFNFNQVVRISRPKPHSVLGHIANFLRLAMNTIHSRETKAMIPDIIALNLVVWAMRNLHQVADPEHIFDSVPPEDENDVSVADQCHSAIREFEAKYQQCGFKFASCEPCINGPVIAHQQLHLSPNNKQANGSFVLRQVLDPNLVGLIRGKFLDHYNTVVTEDRSGRRSMRRPHPDKIKRVREAVMQKYWSHWLDMTSNTTCLACLQAVPENVLHCGHGYCVRCVRELGKPSESFESAWMFEVCSLCCRRTGENFSHLIREPPCCAGVRILTLDGGGIRGIIELALIQEIEYKLALGIPFRDYFDLVVGTSTGGIVGLAISMGDKDADTRTSVLTKAFKSFASATFLHRRSGRLLERLGLGHFVTSVVMSFRLYQAQFDSSPLQAGLERFFGEHTSLFSSARTRHHQCSTRVAVVTTKEFGKRAHLITSYNRATLGSGNDFDREDDEGRGMKIWEAGLATSAAPFYLPPFKKTETGNVYFDGALYMNCPAPGAVEEVKKIWPENTPSLDVLLSLGTGIQESEVKIPKAIRIGGFAEICKTFHEQLDCENQWENFWSSGATDGIRDRLHRLNPPIDEDLQKVALYQWQKMDDLEAMVQRQMEEPDWRARIGHVTTALLASLFYFEPDAEAPLSPTTPTPIAPGAQDEIVPTEIQGTIRTRLRHGSGELSRLLNQVTGLSWTKLSASSRGISISPSMQHEPWTEVPAFTTIKQQVLDAGCAFRVPVHFTEPSETKSLLVAVRFRDSAAPLPISGFPVSLQNLYAKARAWD
ncbi:hypothetical protein A1O7_04479 [Cladophialophora yegresii CBS 114405]|uniref:PNPLA domain-containing protein n=1 Tax=Cladophialophora yegresii CBS 114405 TaxID=1182544 RepID=W9VWZ0_9EURO|nr:uncharacterized protein A1O7_04479 [Cladophialophora yegresii CBS 114405]EXJ60327.1 hypothetical protein A1O7_04479 [Cladophialophora yegresii CBS 114405]